LNLAIAIPIYNQPIILKDCLTSLRNQIFFQSDIFLFDDASNLEYQTIISSFSDLKINYKKNPFNLGAMRNMHHSFNEVRSKNKYDFLMVLHEDDFLSPLYFETVENICVRSQKKPSLILSFFSEFRTPYDCDKILLSNYPTHKWLKKHELVRMFLIGDPIAFGSAIYNTEKYSDFYFDFAKYGEFSDRPFLLNNLDENDDILIITTPLYLLRSHNDNDERWKLLKPIHVFNLVDLYFSILKLVNSSWLNYYKKFSTSLIMDSYRNLRLTCNSPNLIIYIITALIKRQISLKYLLLRNSIINRFFTYFLKSS